MSETTTHQLSDYTSDDLLGVVTDLMNEHGSITTLDTKNRLRKNGLFARQARVSRDVEELYHANDDAERTLSPSGDFFIYEFPHLLTIEDVEESIDEEGYKTADFGGTDWHVLLEDTADPRDLKDDTEKMFSKTREKAKKVGEAVSDWLDSLIS